MTQDLTEYGNAKTGKYLLKGYGSPNRIEVRKNNRTIKVLHYGPGNYRGGELEGVFVDGDTGIIYFTTITKRTGVSHNLNLYEIANYKLPAVTPASKDESNSPSNPNDPSKSKNPTTPSATEEPSSSDSKCVKTAILGKNNEFCDDGQGSGAINIFKTVIEAMTIGVGLLGTLGIVIVGIQYLTAGGNEEKTRKAKRRMFEIIIGLAMYAAIYALLKWLLPSFN